MDRHDWQRSLTYYGDKTMRRYDYMGFGAKAQEGMVYMDIGRAEARLPTYVMPNPQATATVILLPGGDADTGELVDGKPRSGNFFVSFAR
ncbi:MAG: hypothetical protein EBW55_08235 [Betaproteobacteria bacterium]|nr:hypothetical protein [Betaproteobacteria bacterium]